MPSAAGYAAEWRGWHPAGLMLMLDPLCSSADEKGHRRIKLLFSAGARHTAASGRRAHQNGLICTKAAPPGLQAGKFARTSSRVSWSWCPSHSS